jgi:hypothetical protein
VAEKDHFKFGSQKSDAELLKVLRRDNSNLQHEIDGLIPLLTEARRWLEDLNVRWSDHENWSYVRACMQRIDHVLKPPRSQSDAAAKP